MNWTHKNNVISPPSFVHLHTGPSNDEWIRLPTNAEISHVGLGVGKRIDYHVIGMTVQIKRKKTLTQSESSTRTVETM